MKQCKHRLETSQCWPCVNRSWREPLGENALRLTKGGSPVLVVRDDEELPLRVIHSDPRIGFTTMERTALIVPASGLVEEKSLAEMIDSVANLGGLFVPEDERTRRETTDEFGPPHCHYCGERVCFARGTLGCQNCGYYACGCGHCLCGFRGRNYLGHFFTQEPAFPIEAIRRVEYIRAFRYLQRRIPTWLPRWRRRRLITAVSLESLASSRFAWSKPADRAGSELPGAA